MKNKKLPIGPIGILLTVILAVSAYIENSPIQMPFNLWQMAKTGVEVIEGNPEIEVSGASNDWYETIPEYAGEPNFVVNNGIPFFTEEEQAAADVFEEYSELDELGRCGTAFANICPELMPKEERGNIGNVKPSGWHTVKYDVIADRYLYNRCHLIGYQLARENANERNLITGTRYLNVEGMLPWENLVAEYVKETENHVLYRVTPYFEGENLVASGVLIEARSVEDCGQGLCFNVYCYNVQPGVIIDYSTGESQLQSGLNLKEE